VLIVPPLPFLSPYHNATADVYLHFKKSRDLKPKKTESKWMKFQMKFPQVGKKYSWPTPIRRVKGDSSTSMLAVLFVSDNIFFLQKIPSTKSQAVARKFILVKATQGLTFKMLPISRFSKGFFDY